MSQRLINRNPDLKRLRDEGFDLEVRSNLLLVKTVPYVNANKEIKYGILVSELTLAGDDTQKPGTHVIHFAGEHPCRKDGTEIAQIKHGSARNEIDKDLFVDHSFSNKPAEGYTDYYHKVTTYISIISGPAQSFDASVTANTFPVVEAEPEDDSPFNYVDTASSRAEINVATRKLELARVAIVGLGGTGSYVFDLVAKTPVREIHLFDGDTFSQHNAFRSPGAPSAEDLRKRPSKVAYFHEQYSRMRRNIVAHDVFIDATNVDDQLRGMDFVFLSLDRGSAKRLIVETLEECGTPFVDVGMGISLVEGSLLGVLRVTTSTAAKRDHVRAKGRISFSDVGADDDYARNIQVADLNALNATLAVVKWKKLFGFYHDYEREHYSTYTLDTNMLLNDDQP